MSSSALSPRDARRLAGWGPRTVSTAGDVASAQDILFVDGDLALGEGLDALTQDLGAALCTALGADPLDLGFGFAGFEAIAQETDRVMLRERLRVAVVNVLRRDRRIERVEQVLIGRGEIEAARTAEPTASPAAGVATTLARGGSPPPADWGVVDIEAAFRLRGASDVVRLKIGSTLGNN